MNWTALGTRFLLSIPTSLLALAMLFGLGLAGWVLQSLGVSPAFLLIPLLGVSCYLRVTRMRARAAAIRKRDAQK